MVIVPRCLHVADSSWIRDEHCASPLPRVFFIFIVEHHLRRQPHPIGDPPLDPGFLRGGGFWLLGYQGSLAPPGSMVWILAG